MPVLDVVFAHETMSLMHYRSAPLVTVAACVDEFKLYLLVYKALNGLALSYITDMLQPVTTLDRH